MKLDIVIGNPPYNNAFEVEFAKQLYNKCSIAMIFIVPAKWQASSITGKYGWFKENIVKHISHVTFYPDVVDVFNIRNSDGTTVYLAVKGEPEVCTIKNINGTRPEFNNTAIRKLDNEVSLNNLGQDIIDYILNNNKLYKTNTFKFKVLSTADRYSVHGGKKISCGCGWNYTNMQERYALYDKNGAFRVTTPNYIFDNLTQHKLSKTESKYSDATDREDECIVFTSNSLEECESFISFINTKFIRFCMAINISKLTGIYEDNYFRLVPTNPDKPYSWNMIYSDEYFNTLFSLPDKYIKLINTWIKDKG